MDKNLITRTLAFYIMLIILVLVNMYYITNLIINFVNTVMIAIIAYLYMKLINDVNKFYIGDGES